MSTRAVRVFVSGRVQGVFFRDSTRRQARRLGVTGWVRNLRDGRVEAHIEGDEVAVELMIDWCGDGPPMASVTGVEVEEAEAESPSGFRIVGCD